MLLIIVTGEPNSGKDKVASKLGMNADVKYIRPYSDKKIPVNIEPQDFPTEYTYLSEYKLSKKMEHEIPLFTREIGVNRYVVFENQLNADYVVLILDPETLHELQKTYTGRIFSIYCTQNTCDNPQDYDVVFNPRVDDIDFLEVKLYE